MQWIVRKLDRNHQRVLRRTWVRADTRAKAEQIGRELFGGGCVTASEYDASRDPAFVGFIKVLDNGP